MAPSSLEEASARLRALVARRSDGSPVDQQYLEILAARDEVLARFRPMFRAENLSRLTAEAFREFLVFRNNKHWMALQRMGPYVTADMARLREALSLLVDESIPIESRLETLVPTRGPAFVPRLGKAILTPVLLIHDPTRYGVWNRVSEDAMRRLGIFPDIDDVPGFGDRYRRVNDRLVELAGSAAVDQWTLDALWWRLLNLEAGSEALPVDDDDGDRDGEVAPATGGSQRFGLERHLHEFLRDNWSHTELGSEWKLYEKDGDSDAGYEVITDIGRIDLLAKHVTKP